MIGVEKRTEAATTPCLAMRPARAAVALDVSERLLRDWIASGIIPSVRVGGVVLVPVRAAERRLDELSRASEAQPPLAPEAKRPYSSPAH